MTEPAFNQTLHVDPFKELKISNNDILYQIEERSPCSKCKKSRKFFCYNCYLPVGVLAGALPNVELPISIDIIKHRSEILGKSTAAHAAILASKYVTVYEYPMIPDYTKEEGVVLIFPSNKSTNVHALFNRSDVQPNNVDVPKGHCVGTLLKRLTVECPTVDGNGSANENASYELPIKKAVFIDSTWNQSRSIYKDEKINSLRCVVLQNRLSQFWRHQKDSPRWYLATIEAIHQFLIELHINAWGIDETYTGFENLGLNMSSFCDKYRGSPTDGDGSLDVSTPYHELLYVHSSKPSDTSEKEADVDEDQPLKYEFVPVVEKDSFYSKRCKVFVKSDKAYADRGVGMLYLKKVEGSGKTQLLVRADTSLGNILLNVLLSEGLPTQRMGKNNVMLICLPLPDAQGPSSVLIRVKNEDEADDLLAEINKNVK